MNGTNEGEVIFSTLINNALRLSKNKKEFMRLRGNKQNRNVSGRQLIRQVKKS